jgi:hypothetical protein
VPCAVQHRHAPYLLVGHLGEHVLDRRVLGAAEHRLGHHFPRTRLHRVAVIRERTHDDVAVRDHAQHVFAFGDEHRADVGVAHELGHFVYRGIRTDGHHVPGHDFPDLHGELLRMSTARVCDPGKSRGIGNAVDGGQRVPPRQR